MKEVRLSTPVTASDIQALELGTVVYLDGCIYTGREGVYKRLIDDGVPAPTDLAAVSNVNFHCSPAAAVQPDGSYQVGAVTATASFRFSPWLERWFALSGCKVIIGKGGMSERDYRDVFVPHGAVYLTTVGYGTGALLGRGLKRVVDVHWLEELGVAQALWIFEVDRFGPFLVESDAAGNSLFAQQNELVNAGVAKAYGGLKQPVLRRYGESLSRQDEVIGDSGDTD